MTTPDVQLPLFAPPPPQAELPYWQRKGHSVIGEEEGDDYEEELAFSQDDDYPK